MSGIDGNRIDQMSSLASAVLILNLTEMTGVCYSSHDREHV